METTYACAEEGCHGTVGPYETDDQVTLLRCDTCGWGCTPATAARFLKPSRAAKKVGDK